MNNQVHDCRFQLRLNLFSGFACRQFGLLVILCVLVVFPLFAQDAGPKFHIDTPAHAGMVRQILVTGDERFLLTGGVDRTIRVWDSKTGQQVQRWILPNEDDRIHALAISPDNKLLAVGGDLVGSGSDGAVLLLSLQTGRIVKTLTGIRARVSSLAFSLDGKNLAVGFGGARDISRSQVGDLANLITSAQEGSNAIENGVAIYGVADLRLIYSDPLSIGAVVSMVFNSAGNLAVATHEAKGYGRLAIYRKQGGNYERLAKADVVRHAGSGLVWRNDNKTILLGQDGEFGADTINEVAPAFHASREDISAVRFLSDGTPIAAFGTKHNGQGEIKALTDAKWNSSKSVIQIPDSNLEDMRFLSSGQIAYVTDNGTLAMLGADGQMLWRKTSGGISFQEKPDRLRVSGDGQWVGLRYQSADGFQELAFHLESGRFAAISSIKDWREPLVSRSGLALHAWQGTSVGTANGTYFPFRKDGERSLAATVHSSDQSFFYGTDAGRLYKATPSYVRNWRYTTSQSLMMWVRLLGSDVVALNLIEERGLIVVATSDGMLRLLRMRDGAVILTYYIQPGERKWLSIADTGHYEASVGGDNLGGWVLRQDSQQTAEFFPLSRFRDQFLLPGMTRHVLASNDPNQGVQRALAEWQPSPMGAVVVEQVAKQEPLIVPQKITPASELVEIESPKIDQVPPSIEIVSPGFETTLTGNQLSINVRVLTPKDAPLKGVFSRIVSSGQVTRGLHPGLTSVEQTLNLKLPPEDVEVHLVAENRWGSSLPKVIRVRYAGPVAAPIIKQRTLRILAIGVSDYDNRSYRLFLAAKDASDFGRLLSGQRGKLYDKVEIAMLTDKAADKSAIEKAFTNLKKQVRAEDTTFVFLAGHGVNDFKQGYYFMPREADIKRLSDTGVSFRDIRRTLAELPGRNLLFVDTCHAGNVIGSGATGLSQNNSSAINELASPENNIIVFASSSGDQAAIEKDDWGNGAFTKALLEGLQGRADFMKRGRISYKQLDAYVSDRVSDLTDGLQTPVTPVLLTVPDFPLVEVLSN